MANTETVLVVPAAINGQLRSTHSKFIEWQGRRYEAFPHTDEGLADFIKVCQHLGPIARARAEELLGQHIVPPVLH